MLTTDNDDDCLSLWVVLIENGADKGATDNSAEFIVNYEGAGVCSYTSTDDGRFSFLYDSTTGKVTVSI